MNSKRRLGLCGSLSLGRVSLAILLLFVSFAKVSAQESGEKQDALIKNITIDGSDLEFFSSDKLDYTYYLPYTHPAKVIPKIECVKGRTDALVEVAGIKKLTGDESARTAVITVSDAARTSKKMYKITFQILPKLDIFFCIGQSNMAGRGYIDESLGDLVPISNTFLLTPECEWEVAVNPLNRYSSSRKASNLQRISPAYGFALYMKDKVSNPIGLVVNAKGGSSIGDWTIGSKAALYEGAIKRAKEAQKWGEIKAVLWHQGESNSSSKSVPLYPDNLKAMVDLLRKDLNSPNLLFVAGEIAYWRSNGSGSTEFNKMIRGISGFIDNSAYVSAEGLTPLIDDKDPHFDRASNIELGKRYAELIYNRIYLKKK